MNYAQSLHPIPRDEFELAQQAVNGLPIDALDELTRKGIVPSETAEIVIPPRTLKHRRARGQRLSLEESERLLRVIRVITFADRVFGDHTKAMGWLRMPNDRLQDESALSVLRSESGARFVEGMLWSISENMYQ